MKDSFIANFSKGFIKKSRVTFLLFFTILILGYVSYSGLLKREGFPSVDIPFAIIQTPYFVNDPSLVDQDVTTPIESEISQIEEVQTFSSTTSSNFSVIFAEFDDETSSEEGAKLIEETLAGIELNAEPEVVTIEASKFNGEYDILLNVVPNEELSVKELQDKADEIGEKLEESNRIARADTIELVSEQINPITGESFDYQTGFNRVGTNTGDKVEFKEAIAIGLVKKGDLDSIDFSNEVKDLITKLEEEGSSEDVEVLIAADFAKELEGQLGDLESNFMSGLIAVLVVLFFFIN